MLKGFGGHVGMMDADYRNYLKSAQGEEPPISLGDPRWAETETLARRLIAGAQAEGALRALAQEPQARKRWDLLLLAGLLHQGLGEGTSSLEALEVVCDKLVAAAGRDGVRALLPRFLEPAPVSAAVRFLHFLARSAADEAERIDWLSQAIHIRPRDPELLYELAQALDRTGDADSARSNRILALEIRLELKHPDPVSEELLRLVDEDFPREPQRVARILLRYAALVPWADAEPILDLALPELERRASGRIDWSEVEPVLSRTPPSPEARKLAAAILRVAVAAQPDPDAIVEGSGIRNPAEPIESIRSRVSKILALPPGSDVAHATWGIGRVSGNDGESITLEFPGRPAHRMSLAMAERSLDRLPAEGLRVMAARAPDRLREMVQGRDPRVLVMALRDAGGTATLAQLKPRIEASLAGADWSAWWKEVKERLKGNPALDLSEAYRQVFRLAAEGRGAGEAVLPELNPRAGEGGIGLIRKFLREHPEQEPRLKEHAAAFVARWAAEPGLAPAIRAQALCYTTAWRALPPGRAREILEDLIGAGFSPDDVAQSGQQDVLLDLARDASHEEAFLWRALESRLPRLRDHARARLRIILGDAFGRAIVERLRAAAEGPSLAARLIEHYATHREEPEAPSPSALLLTGLRLLERDAGQAGAAPAVARTIAGSASRFAAGGGDRLIELMQPEGALHRLLEREPLDPEALESVERTVLHWRGSERRLHPVLELLRAIGHSELADTHEARRSAKAQSLLEGKSIEDLETRHTIMSRETYEKLESELKRLRLDLKTTIPASIEKARQLGDLRENAEYEAAKQRQANAAARAQELLSLLERTRLLETIEVDATRVGVGTEVALEPLDPSRGEPIRYWILGEGDHALGPGILSYRAPILRPLLGKTQGAEVLLELPGVGAQPFRIASIRKRLPGDPA